MNQSTDQVSNFLSQTEQVEHPEATYEGANSPRIPFPTSYKLTRDQEDKLVAHAMQRLKELEDELGRNVVTEADWYMKEVEAGGEDKRRRSFLGKRQLFEMLYHNQVDWRPSLLGGIFAESNLVVPLVRRIARQMIARANNYFFGTDPWCAVYPVGQADRQLAQDLDRYLRFKFDESHLKDAEMSAVELAFVRGECVMKTTYEVRDQIFEQTASVLVDEQGRDILDSSGDYIMQEDLWVDENAGMTDEMGQPLPQGRMVLKRELSVSPEMRVMQPEAMQFEVKLVTRRKVIFEGAKSEPVFYKDFLCPLSAPSVQEADCIVQLYDMPVMDIADMYQRKAMLNMNDKQSVEATKRAIELIRSLASEDGQAKAHRNQPRIEIGESSITTNANIEPTAQIAEFHMRYDANGDGIMEEIMLVLDRQNQTPIFYDYEANITPDGERPYDVTRVNPVDGRWYGIGAIESFESTQEIVDLLVNRWNFSMSRAARVDFWNPSCTLEGDRDPYLKLNQGETYTLKPGKTAEDALQSVRLDDNKYDELRDTVEFFLQMATNESGVANANDSRAAGLDTGELATGVRNIEKSGQEMFSLYLSHLEPGLQSVTRRNALVTLKNLQQEEVFQYFEGEAYLLGQINPDDVKDVLLNVSLLLTRYRGEQLLQSNLQATDIVEKYYLQPPEVQERVAPLYRDMLKALQINSADEIIAPMMMPAPAGAGNVNAAEATAAVTPKPRMAGPNL